MVSILFFQVRNNKKTAVLAVCESDAKSDVKKDKNNRLFVLYRPNTGLQMKQEPYSDLKKKYKKIKSEEAKEHWEGQFNSSSHTCSHAYWLVLFCCMLYVIASGHYNLQNGVAHTYGNILS